MQDHMARKMCRLDGRFTDAAVTGRRLQYGKAPYQRISDPPASGVSKVSRDERGAKCKWMKSIRLPPFHKVVSMSFQWLIFMHTLLICVIKYQNLAAYVMFLWDQFKMDYLYIVNISNFSQVFGF